MIRNNQISKLDYRKKYPVVKFSHQKIQTNKFQKCDDDQKRCVDKTKEVIYTDQICYQFWTPSRDYITWCQSACGIPHVLASNPTEEVCEKWNVSCGR